MMPITIQLNKENYELPSLSSLADLIQSLQLDAKNIAVELNREIISKSRLKEVQLQDKDEVYLVRFVGGG
jgi:thiazole synthase